MSSDNPEIHTEDIALFSRPPVNVAEDRVSWHEIRPSYMSNAEYSSINFSIVGNSTQYVKLSDTELYVRIAIQKEDATPYVTVRSRMFTVVLQTNGFRRCAGLFSSIVTLKGGLSCWLPSSGGPCRVY